MDACTHLHVVLCTLYAARAHSTRTCGDVARAAPAVAGHGLGVSTRVRSACRAARRRPRVMLSVTRAARRRVVPLLANIFTFMHFVPAYQVCGRGGGKGGIR